MTPITHPLAIAYLDAEIAYLKAPRRGNSGKRLAAVRAYDAWVGAGYPLRLDLPKNTVKVRIAVSVNDKGHGIARCVNPGESEPGRIGGDRLTFVTADVPLPEPAAEVVGSVEP